MYTFRLTPKYDLLESPVLAGYMNRGAPPSLPRRYNVRAYVRSSLSGLGCSSDPTQAATIPRGALTR